MSQDRTKVLTYLFNKSALSTIFTVKREDYYADWHYTSLRFETTDYRVRAIELWEPTGKDRYFKIYHSDIISPELKEEIHNIPGVFRSTKEYACFKGVDYLDVCRNLCAILGSATAIEAAKKSKVYSRTSSYEGLTLPDVDTTDNEVLGRTFTFREIIAISENTDENNPLKEALSNNGVYLQRSVDGTSRYIGSAYNSDGGILSRWMTHLSNGGDAKHLGLYILENGYKDVLFTVLEFANKEDAISIETRWKTTLGTKNSGPYNGLQLNNN